MPNHFHAVVLIISTDDKPERDNGRSGRLVAPVPVGPTGPHRKSIAALMAGFKSAATKRINEHRDASNEPVWQRGYYEHIIRSEKSLNHIRQYITENPERWSVDRDNPDAVTPELKYMWRI